MTVDLTEEEHDILLRNGLQLWVDKTIGQNKVKVLPVDKNKKISKSTKQLEIGDEFAEELISISVVEALKEGIKKSESAKNK